MEEPLNTGNCAHRPAIRGRSPFTALGAMTLLATLRACAYAAPPTTAPAATTAPVVATATAPTVAAGASALPMPTVEAAPSNTTPAPTTPIAATATTAGAAGTTANGTNPTTPANAVVDVTGEVGGDETDSSAESAGGHYTLSSPDGVIYDMGRGLALAQGAVSFGYREFVVRGDRGLIDYNKNQAIITGRLTATVRGRVIHGKSLSFDLDSGKWTMTQLATTFPPNLFPPGAVLAPLYLSGASVSGQDDYAEGSDFRFSSCDRGHYYIRSKRIDFYRDAAGRPDRIALHSNGLYVLGHKVLPLPVYVISLKGATSRSIGLQPVVGQNAVDGIFAKTVYNLAADSKHTDSLLIDAMQNRGLGLGLQRELAEGKGLYYLYALTGTRGGREIDSRIQRNFAITPRLSSILLLQTTQNNAYGGEGTASQDGSLQFNFVTPRVKTSVLGRFDNSSDNFASFRSYGASVQHHQVFGEGWSLDANSLYNGTRNSGLPETSTLDNSLRLTDNTRNFDVFLNAELHDDLTGLLQQHGAYQLERLPEFAFSSNTKRLNVPFLDHALPADIGFSLGEYNEPQTLTTTRALFSYSTHPRTFGLVSLGGFQSVLIANSHFEQAVYGNDTARYNYNYHFALNNSMGRLSGLVNYYRQRTLGYTPFQFDFLPPANYADATLAYSIGQKFRLNLTSGRDFENNFTRDLDARVQWSPSTSFYTSLGATYSPDSHTLGDIIGNFHLSHRPKGPFGGSLDLGVRYSPSQNAFSRINTSVDLYAGKKTRIQALTGYNGIARQIDFNQIRISRDLHCFNLYATYDQTNKEFRLDLSLKAFPFTDTRFGVGEVGQGFDPSIGTYQ